MEKYKCMKEGCGCEWDGNLGPPNICPKCRGMYSEWISFDKWDYDGEKWFKKV